VARYLGAVEPEELGPLYRGAAVVVQPSRYEPFALTVGEALAAGTPVVATDEVGASEFVEGPACVRYLAADRAALEAAVRRMIERERTDGPALRREARAQAERAFAPDVVAEALLTQLERLTP
jgi:glycosyltransferase involved in cell wall biosynthesis